VVSVNGLDPLVHQRRQISKMLIAKMQDAKRYLLNFCQIEKYTNNTNCLWIDICEV
jgi:hypothetical protein